MNTVVYSDGVRTGVKVVSDWKTLSLFFFHGRANVTIHKFVALIFQFAV